MNWVSTRFAWRSSDWFISSRQYWGTNNLTGWRKCLDIKIIWETNTADQRGVILSAGQFYCLQDCNDPFVCFHVKISIFGWKPIVRKSLKDLNNEKLQPQSAHKMGHNQNLPRARTEVTNNSHLENNTALTST